MQLKFYLTACDVNMLSLDIRAFQNATLRTSFCHSGRSQGTPRSRPRQSLRDRELAAADSHWAGARRMGHFRELTRCALPAFWELS